jgi:hypothetical protein
VPFGDGAARMVTNRLMRQMKVVACSGRSINCSAIACLAHEFY